MFTVWDVRSKGIHFNVSYDAFPACFCFVNILVAIVLLNVCVHFRFEYILENSLHFSMF